MKTLEVWRKKQVNGKKLKQRRRAFIDQTAITSPHAGKLFFLNFGISNAWK